MIWVIWIQIASYDNCDLKIFAIVETAKSEM